MERGKTTEAVHGEIHLHESIIQHIQSFLSSKEAAQTSILSKTWYNAWLTRPVVDIDQRHSQNRSPAKPGKRKRIDGFLESSKRIIRRYEQSNLKIESFRFCMEDIRSYNFWPVNDLIASAMKLGACDVNVEIIPRTIRFDLSNEVLRSENLVRLSVSGCRINLEEMRRVVVFSKLKSLSLRGVCIVGIPTLDIASNSPLIEELVLSECMRVYSSINTGNIWRKLGLGSLSEHEKKSLGSIVEAPIRPYTYLKRLYLKMIRIDDLLFNDMSRYFPCLKDLTLSWCSDFTGLQIYSPSLEFLSLDNMNLVCKKLDFPSLRKFTFSNPGSSLSFPSFEAASREWESDISIYYRKSYIRSNWLDTLKNFLIKLSLPKMSLSLCFWFSTVNRLYLSEPSPCLPKPEVENLKLSMDIAPTLVRSSLLEGVFLTCRPKFITLDLRPQFWCPSEEKCNMLKLLSKILIEEVTESCCIPSRHMSDMYGLEKVDVEAFEDSLAEWQPLPWKALIDASERPKKEQKLRFKLGWRQNPSPNTSSKGHSF